MQAKSDAEMSIFEGKAKGGAMTPTTQIAAIRQKRWLDRDGDDVNTLLALWDTHQSALRGLVAQWRETGKLFRARAISQRAARTTSGRMADAYFGMADDLERLLESEP